MPDPFTFDLVSPEKLLLSEDVEMVVVPGAEGDFGVLIGHAPLISGCGRALSIPMPGQRWKSGFSLQVGLPK